MMLRDMQRKQNELGMLSGSKRKSKLEYRMM